jgi:hypothetical protein
VSFVHAAAAAAVFACALVGALAAVFGNRENHDARFTVFGACLVAGVALVANNAWVYGLAVVLVAAPIAGPVYAQNIAAIFLDRKWAFGSIGIPVKAALAGIADRAPSIARSLTPGGQAMLPFGDAAFQALATSTDWPNMALTTQVELVRGPRTRISLDAVGLKDDGSATIFEFKDTNNSRSLRDAISSLQHEMEAYRSASGSPVAGTLVVPPGASSMVPRVPGVAVAVFDPVTNRIEYESD